MRHQLRRKVGWMLPLPLWSSRLSPQHLAPKSSLVKLKDWNIVKKTIFGALMWGMNPGLSDWLPLNRLLALPVGLWFTLCNLVYNKQKALGLKVGQSPPRLETGFPSKQPNLGVHSDQISATFPPFFV